MKTYVRKWGPLAAVLVLAVVAFLLGPALAMKVIGGGAAMLGMGLSFNSIPNNLRVPFVAAEFDNSHASGGAALLPYKGLIIGQKLSTGTGVANTVVRVTNVNQAIVVGGRGSMLHQQARAWFNVNKFTDVYLGVLADNGAGVAATKTLTFTGTATAAGTLNLYIGGVNVQVAVASGDVNTAVATATGAAVNLNTDLICTAGVASGVVTLTFRHKGAACQDVDVRVNYQSGEATPAGVTLVIANATSGITNPVLTTLIAALGDTWFQVWTHPYTDATSLTAIEAELHDRFGPMRMIDGVAFTSAVGSVSVLGTLGLTRNSQHSCILAQPGENPVTPPYEFAAAQAAQLAYYGNIDPARPFQTLELPGVLPPAEIDLFTFTERNLLLFDGIGTSKVVAGGVVQIERPITTYTLNSAGGADSSYLDVTTMLTLLYLRYSFRQEILQKFPRHKLASNGTRVPAGQAIVTPNDMKAQCVAWFRDMEDLGLVEGFDQFKTDLVVEHNVQDVNRLDVLLPPDLINQLMVTATSIQFRL